MNVTNSHLAYTPVQPMHTAIVTNNPRHFDPGSCAMKNSSLLSKGRAPGCAAHFALAI
jgi:hypothetical protein